MGPRRRRVLGSAVVTQTSVEREFLETVHRCLRKEPEIVKGSRRYREGSKG